MLSHITKTIRVNIKENHPNLLSKEVALAVTEIALIGIFIIHNQQLNVVLSTVGLRGQGHQSALNTHAKYKIERLCTLLRRTLMTKLTSSLTDNVCAKGAPAIIRKENRRPRLFLGTAHYDVSLKKKDSKEIF